jgi:hypothetical protein
MHRVSHPLLKLLILGTGCFIAEHFCTSYRFVGVLMITAFDLIQTYTREHENRWYPLAIFAVLTAYTLYYLVHGLKPLNFEHVKHAFLTYNWSQTGAFLAFPLLCMYNGKEGLKSTLWVWLYRIFYPLHLSVCLLVEAFLTH